MDECSEVVLDKSRIAGSTLILEYPDTWVPFFKLDLKGL
jgi:hypothetical protein